MIAPIACYANKSSDFFFSGGGGGKAQFRDGVLGTA